MAKKPTDKADDILRYNTIPPFEIVARPACSEPRWKRRGSRLVFAQSAALKLVADELRRKHAVDERYEVVV